MRQMLVWCVCLGMMGAAVPCQADRMGVYGLAGFASEAEFDDVDFENEAGTVELDLDDDEDLEDNFGLALSYDLPVFDPLSIGGFVGVLFADGEESDGDYLTLDVGVHGRYGLDLGKVDLDFMLAVGPSLVRLTNVDGIFDDYAFTGLGFFITGGVLIEIPLKGDTALVGGLLLSRHGTGEIEDEERIDPFGDVTITLEDGTFFRMLLTIGVLFEM